MKTSELRIGSLVDIINRSNEVHLPTGSIFRIIAIGLFDVQCIPNDIKIAQVTSDAILTVPLRDLIPIKISEEWLELSCFQQVSYMIKGNYYIQGSRYIIGSIQSDGNRTLSIELGDDEFFITNKCNYIHEIQNLFIDLKGEELEL